MNIIFHHPLPLDPDATSASGIRPLRMLEAFRSLGYSVDLVVGYSTERSKSIGDIKNKIKQGKKYDFLYAESSTMPTILADRDHLPRRPLMDWWFFRYCKSNRIPIGLFYRDIYWKFETYGRELNTFKVIMAKISYLYDLWTYNKSVDVLYLPSLEMGEVVPIISKSKFKPLPPGYLEKKYINLKSEGDNKNNIKLFYVGGLTDHYKMHKLFEAVKELSFVELVICTRENEWEGVKHQYAASKNITIMHAKGEEMELKMKQCDIALLFVEPQIYWSFAVPVKLFEYIGFNKPILASSDTLAGQLVQDRQIGWSIEYDIEGLKQLLSKLKNNPDHISDLKLNVDTMKKEHTWIARAKQVSTDLTGK